MRFAVVGAGAIGAFVGALLSRAGEDVMLIARGEHLRAMREHGVRVRGAVGDFVAHPQVTDDLAAVGEVDVVMLTLKAHSLSEMAPRLSPLMGAETSVLAAQNGIPWWYFYRHGGELEELHLETIDPDGIISRSIDPARVIGCVVYCSTITAEPGVIEHVEGSRFAIGEPDGTKSDRCRNIAKAFIRAGLRCPVRNDIRHDIWVKLLGSVAFNPISALSRATLVDLVQYPETRLLASQIMAEADKVAKRLGIDVAISIEQRLVGAEKVGPHKTSMLQDVEAGRPLELESIVGAVVELADKLGVPTPYTRSVYSCAKLLSQKI
ncbi:MAG: 2-dehydropantoate 2-reductase [Pyrinomonadaceae bacterium]|nr:2-dehydropantoate 2-reductase [Pyrinomonadaceae bacterium]